MYGETLTPNVIDTLSPSLLTSFAKVFMAIHLILAFLIIINPVSQDLEEIFNVPKSKYKYTFYRRYIISKIELRISIV